MTNHQRTTRIVHTAPDSGKDSKGSMQTYRTRFMGNTTSKHRVGQQRERTHSLTSQTVMFTLLKCTGSCDLQNKHLQFRGHFFPMQTIIAQIRLWNITDTELFIKTCTKSATAQTKCICHIYIFFSFQKEVRFPWRVSEQPGFWRALWEKNDPACLC